MTNTYLILKDVSHVLPDGRALFSGLNEQFDDRSTGLVGRNGVGKTVLARILAGLLQPASGQCLKTCTTYYLAQQTVPVNGSTVADLAGVRQTLDALSRIELGSTAPEDFDAVGDHWDMNQRLRHELERNGLSYLETSTPVSSLSGGEAVRVGLIGAMLSNADFLILDEPSNHLDRPNRQALIEQLQQWQRGLLVISHDRQLLDTMKRIVELSPKGLRSYGGNYSFYAKSKAREQQSAHRQLEQSKLERKREERATRKQRERQTRRQACSNRRGKEANQAKVLLDRQKERSENSAGTLHQKQAANQARLNQRVRDAAQRVEDETEIILHDIPLTQTAKRRVVTMDDIELPYVTGNTRIINLALYGRQRIGVVGPNGCGKTTLMRVLAGQISPVNGFCSVTPKRAYLDQCLQALAPEKTVLEQLRLANSTATEADLRMRLAQLGLDAQRIVVPSGSLSGGERLKGALANILYADSPPELLLLDEPSNHLDLPSIQALEAMLRSYQGTLVVVSHDDSFLGNIKLTDRLLAIDQGWYLEPVRCRQ